MGGRGVSRSCMEERERERWAQWLRVGVQAAAARQCGGMLAQASEGPLVPPMHGGAGGNDGYLAHNCPSTTHCNELFHYSVSSVSPAAPPSASAGGEECGCWPLAAARNVRATTTAAARAPGPWPGSMTREHSAMERVLRLLVGRRCSSMRYGRRECKITKQGHKRGAFKRWSRSRSRAVDRLECGKVPRPPQRCTIGRYRRPRGFGATRGPHAAFIRRHDDTRVAGGILCPT